MTKTTTLKRGLFITAELLCMDCVLGVIATFGRNRHREMKEQAAAAVISTGYIMAAQTVLVLPPALALLHAGGLAS